MVLGFVVIDGRRIFINFIEDKLGGSILGSQDVYKYLTVSGRVICWDSAVCFFWAAARMKRLTNDHLPKRKHPGSFLELTALFSIIFRNSSIRSGWISASTITANGLDMLRDVDEYRRLLKAGFWKAWEERSKRKQVLESIFMLDMLHGAVGEQWNWCYGGHDESRDDL
jgi:hypothetical protein